MTRVIWTIPLLALIVVLAGTHSSVPAQTSRTTGSNVSITAEKGADSAENLQSPNPMAEEMRAKREIRYAEKEHRQNLNRAQEASDLAQALASSFKQKQSLDRDDLKKLERLEKLASKIRDEAGGSEDEGSVEKRPNDLREAIECIAKVSSSLNEKVQQTPRRVVSADTIGKANVLLELIRIARSFFRKI